MSQPLTEEDKKAIIREQTRLRQQRYYERNKDKINEQLREARAELKQCKIEKKEVENELLTEAEKSEPLKVATLDNLISQFQSRLKDRSANTYIGSMKRIWKIMDWNSNTDLNKQLKNTKTIIEEIDDSINAVNTQKADIQALLKAVDFFKLNISKKNRELIADEFAKLKILSNELSSKKIASKPTINMESYLKMIKGFYKETDKMYVLIQLYNELTIRDDYGSLKIVNRKQDMKDKGNFIYLNNSMANGEILINEHKTDKKYGAIRHKLSKELTRLIKNYIGVEQLQVGDFLFGSGKLSQFVSRENKNISTKHKLGGINEIRHRKIAELLGNKKRTPEERVKLAKMMNHSPATQEKYHRENLIDE